MQMCPYCGKVYDESDYSRCPKCSGELEFDMEETKIKICPDCDSSMYWDDWDNHWKCSNCECTVDVDEDDYDCIIEE